MQEELLVVQEVLSVVQEVQAVAQVEQVILLGVVEVQVVCHD